MPPISPERWRVLSPYLDEALEIPPDERSAWLALIGAGDPALAAELRVMLAEHAVVHESHFLERALLHPRGGFAQSLVGQTVGPYRLVSLIGQGGTGAVWLGERCDGRFEGHVAIKLLNISLMGRAGEERFRREGTFLARLKHPRIAHLIDAGVSSAAQPYLVIEYVDGQPIDRHSDERALGLEARIRLFLQVLEAVAHAHANLIVHRDIKPANVLVSNQGQVKLLDFGIAKLVDPAGEWDAATGASALTREGGHALTPEFAAPEQLAGGTVTTATDVYALGVLLYILLTGQHPAGDAVSSPATLMRAIVDTEPRRVSEAVVSQTLTSDALARHASQLGTTPQRLRRTLSGDLDTIVAKALKKNAAERYPSVTALADDLQRVLRNEPISARPDTLSYRLQMFVRRNVRGVAATAAVVVLIGILTAIYTARLSAERDRAQREASKAVKVSDLMLTLMTNVDPYAPRSTPADPTMRGLFDASVEQVQSELAEEPELQSHILTMIGRTYRRLAVYDKAQRLLEQALVSGTKAFGPEHVRVAQTHHEIGVVLAEKGDYAGAALSLERAVDLRRKLLGPEHADVAVTLAELGRVYQDKGLNARAEPLHQEALEIRRRTLGGDHRETAVSLSDLASVKRLNGDLAAAEELLQQCLALNVKTRGELHPNTLVTLHDLSLIATARGDYTAAEKQLQYVAAMQREALGENHPVVATTLNSLSRVLAASHRHDEAAVALQEALNIVRPRLGKDHQLVAIYAINLGAIHLARGQPRAAEPLLREGLRIRMQAPDIVPMRRRTSLDDDWSVEKTQRLLEASAGPAPAAK